MPAEPEAHALAALVLLHDSRRATRVDADGALVPLDEQDRAAGTAAASPAGWSGCGRPPGRAGPICRRPSIAAVHATAAVLGADRLGHHLRGIRPAVDDDRFTGGAGANRALAIGFRDGVDAGLAALDEIANDPRLARSNLVPSIRADLLRRAVAGGRRRPLVSEGVGGQRIRAGRAFLRAAHRRM